MSETTVSALNYNTNANTVVSYGFSPACVSYDEDENGRLTATVVADRNRVLEYYSLRCYEGDGTVEALTGKPSVESDLYNSLGEFLYSHNLQLVQPRLAAAYYFGSVGSRLLYWLGDDAGHVLGWFSCDRNTEALPESVFLSLDHVNWFAPPGYTFYKTYEEAVPEGSPDVVTPDPREYEPVLSNRCDDLSRLECF
jgi:hypothetical protein